MIEGRIVQSRYLMCVRTMTLHSVTVNFKTIFREKSGVPLMWDHCYLTFIANVRTFDEHSEIDVQLVPLSLISISSSQASHFSRSPPLV